jgi:purine-nucleoside phosphorylase
MNNLEYLEYKRNIKRAAETISSAVSSVPKVCIILGSGLSSFADSLTETKEIPYDSIPGFPEVTVPGHEGILIIGNLLHIPVLLLKGRFHYYEGHPIENVVFPVRLMAELGVSQIILTNAAGGINPAMKPGDLMIIRDHIGLFCESPLRGHNFIEYGPRFPDQSKIYDWKTAIRCAEELNISSFPGVYAYVKGPMFETPAEINLLSKLGADAVGMSTVPEAIAASHAGMKVTGISCITNFAAGILDQPLSHDEVLEVGMKTADNIKKLIIRILTDKAVKSESM